MEEPWFWLAYLLLGAAYIGVSLAMYPLDRDDKGEIENADGIAIVVLLILVTWPLWLVAELAKALTKLVLRWRGISPHP